MTHEEQEAGDLHAAYLAWGTGIVVGLLEQAMKLDADPSFRPWAGGVYRPMAAGPVIGTLARLARDREITRVEYRFPKRSGGDGELVSISRLNQVTQ